MSVPQFQKDKLRLANAIVEQQEEIIALLREINSKLPPYVCKKCNKGFLTDSSLLLHTHENKI